jgi:hypothetical protein
VHFDLRLSLELSASSQVVGGGRYRTRTFDLVRGETVFALLSRGTAGRRVKHGSVLEATESQKAACRNEGGPL